MKWQIRKYLNKSLFKCSARGRDLNAIEIIELLKAVWYSNKNCLCYTERYILLTQVMVFYEKKKWISWTTLKPDTGFTGIFHAFVAFHDLVLGKLVERWTWKHQTTDEEKTWLEWIKEDCFSFHLFWCPALTLFFIAHCYSQLKMWLLLA